MSTKCNKGFYIDFSKGLVFSSLQVHIVDFLVNPHLLRRGIITTQAMPWKRDLYIARYVFALFLSFITEVIE